MKTYRYAFNDEDGGCRTAEEYREFLLAEGFPDVRLASFSFEDGRSAPRIVVEGTLEALVDFSGWGEGESEEFYVRELKLKEVRS